MGKNDFKSTIANSRLFECGSFLKPTAVAAAVLAKQNNQISKLRKAIDLYQLGLKLIDDLVDWQIDLEYHNTTLFLNYVRRWYGYSNIEQDDVHRFMIASDMPILMLNESINATKSARAILNDRSYRYVSSFLDERINFYHDLKKELIRSRRKIVVSLEDILTNIDIQRKGKQQII